MNSNPEARNVKIIRNFFIRLFTLWLFWQNKKPILFLTLQQK